MADELYARSYNNDEIWGLDYEEIGLVMCKEAYIPANTNPMKLKIRTIMPKQLEEADGDPSLDPKDWAVPLNPTIFCNDTPCMPKVSGSIGMRNYISVPRNANSEFFHKWINRGAKVKVELRNEDIDDMHVSNNLDESFCFDCETEHPLCTTRYRCPNC